jgi:CheY-like chemotaxis protein
MSEAIERRTSTRRDGSWIGAHAWQSDPARRWPASSRSVMRQAARLYGSRRERSIGLSRSSPEGHCIDLELLWHEVRVPHRRDHREQRGPVSARRLHLGALAPSSALVGDEATLPLHFAILMHGSLCCAGRATARRGKLWPDHPRSHAIDTNGAVRWPHSCERGEPDPPLRTRSRLIGLLVAIQHSVLVVDDDGDVCELLSELLSQAGYDVRCAHDGEEAWADVQRNPPDLILSDIRMPKLDGIDLASRLISEGYRAPIILMSASHMDRTGVSAAFIRKPFAFDHLLAVITRVLDTPAAQRGPAVA